MTESVIGTKQTNAWAQLRARLADFPEAVAFISFFVIFVFFVVRADNFLSLISITNILTIASIKGIFVVGVAMLMISGEFDLSVGSILAVSGFIFVLLIEGGWPVIPAALIALVVSSGFGFINGWIVIKTGIPSLISLRWVRYWPGRALGGAM